MTKLVASLALASIAVAASAQLPGFRVFAGYGWSGSISNTTTGSTHLLGPEIGFDLPVSRIGNVSETDFRADVLLGGQLAHGSDLDGYVYRLLLMARTAVPGSQVSTFGGFGWGFAQARNGEFSNFNGFISQVGVDIPLGTGLPKISPALEVTASFGKSGLSGYSVCAALHF